MPFRGRGTGKGETRRAAVFRRAVGERSGGNPGRFACDGCPLLGSFLEPAARVGDATNAHAPDRKAPTEDHGDLTACAGSILAGKYKLIEEIGEGGMGRVYMAQQTEPVRRAVAVKVIKAGMDSKAVLARFEAERQALALMDHPTSPGSWTPAPPTPAGPSSSWSW